MMLGERFRIDYEKYVEEMSLAFAFEFISLIAIACTHYL